MNKDGARKVPADAPTSFIRRRWEGYVLGSEGIDRRFYELCVMSELKNALRSGDVSVVGSRQFKDFEDYLIPRSEFDGGSVADNFPASVATVAEGYLEERLFTVQGTRLYDRCSPAPPPFLLSAISRRSSTQL